MGTPFSATPSFLRTRTTPMAHSDLGTKRQCPSCSSRFYDLNKRPISCPKCQYAFEPEVLLKSRKPRAAEKPKEAAPAVVEVEEEEEEVDKEFLSLLNKPISELELSVRSANCLEAANIKTIGDLVGKSEAVMLKYKNFGKKSLDEIKDRLKDMGLSLGMQV